MEQQLVNYVEQECKRGVPENMIKKALREVGWGDQQIEEAFGAVQSRATPPVPKSGIFVKDKSAGTEDGFGAGEKKGIKPLAAAITLFFVLLVVVGGLVAYFNFIEPADQAADIRNTGQTKKTVQAPTTTISDAITKEDAGNGKNEPPLPTGIGTSGVVAAATSTPVSDIDVATTTGTVGVEENDAKRMQDMENLVSMQKKWFESNGKYYTCGLNSGDCKGKPYGYPAQIGAAELITSQDPLASGYAGKKAVCGKDYVYCGLNNSSYSNFFCYYAKLEGGGYYTASHAGNFKRATPPKIFEDCATAN